MAKTSKKGSKELEQGLLAADSLHKAVMPFVLRRTKDQVLKDLPPKIIQVSGHWGRQCGPMTSAQGAATGAASTTKTDIAAAAFAGCILHHVAVANGSV